MEDIMARMTVWLQPKVYRALKVKSATTDRSVSELVNAAVIEALRKDAIDVEAFDKRSKEPTRSFEQVLKDLKRDGLFRSFEQVLKDLKRDGLL
jgi:hypothetical protein